MHSEDPPSSYRKTEPLSKRYHNHIKFVNKIIIEKIGYKYGKNTIKGYDYDKIKDRKIAS